MVNILSTEPSILLAATRLSPNILIHYLSPSIKLQSFREDEKPSLAGNFFQSLARSLPTDNNERTKRRVRVKLFYLHRSFSFCLLRSFFFAHPTYIPTESLPTLTAKKALATARHSFNLRITKRYPRQIPGLVLRRSYLHFSQGIIFHIFLYVLYIFAAMQHFCIIYAK